MQEYILGFKLRKDILRLEPNIPSSWKEYQIRYRYKSSVYNLKIKNPNGKNNGIEQVIVNGQKLEKKEIKLIDNGKINDIEFIM